MRSWVEAFIAGPFPKQTFIVLTAIQFKKINKILAIENLISDKDTPKYTILRLFSIQFTFYLFFTNEATLYFSSLGTIEQLLRFSLFPRGATPGNILSQIFKKISCLVFWSYADLILTVCFTVKHLPHHISEQYCWLKIFWGSSYSVLAGLKGTNQYCPI